jgi:hypothetical protein
MLFSSWGFNNEFSVNVWAHTVGDWVIGPYVLPRRFTGAVYHNFFGECSTRAHRRYTSLGTKLYDSSVLGLWFISSFILDSTKSNLWCKVDKQGGSIPWPSHSLDLFGGGRIFEIFCLCQFSPWCSRVAQHVENACETIREKAGICEHVR